jgi:hypothetical protein
MDIPWLGIIVSIIGLMIWRKMRKTPLARWKSITFTFGLTFLIGTVIALFSLRLPSLTSPNDYGASCNEADFDRTLQLLKDFTTAKNADDFDPSAYANKVENMWNVLNSFRTNLRRLELPTLSDEQSALVDETETYLTALNAHRQSGYQDLSVNDALIPFTDSLEDFLSPFEELCANR